MSDFVQVDDPDVNDIIIHAAGEPSDFYKSSSCGGSWSTESGERPIAYNSPSTQAGVHCST